MTSLSTAHTRHASPAESVGYSEEYQLTVGSLLFPLFAGAFFDQVMLPEVAAGVEWTGRIRHTPWQRAMRSAAADQLVFLGSDADRLAESRRLIEAHRDVKGVGFNGTRFSALNPESWNWILMSTIRAYHQFHAVLAREPLSSEEQQEFYAFLLAKSEHLQLPARASRLPETYSEFLTRYDQLIRDKGETNIAVEGAVETFLRAPAPVFLPTVTKPVWMLIARIAGHIAAVCSFGIMHPTARELTGFGWTRRHDLEFRVITTAVAVMHRRGPRRLTLTPLAYHRWRAEKLSQRYRDMRLASFAPDRTA